MSDPHAQLMSGDPGPGKRPDDIVRKIVAEKSALMEGFIRGFCAASGLGPEELELVEQNLGDKIVFSIRRRGDVS